QQREAGRREHESEHGVGDREKVREDAQNRKPDQAKQGTEYSVHRRDAQRETYRKPKPFEAAFTRIRSASPGGKAGRDRQQRKGARRDPNNEPGERDQRLRQRRQRRDVLQQGFYVDQGVRRGSRD